MHPKVHRRCASRDRQAGGKGYFFLLSCYVARGGRVTPCDLGLACDGEERNANSKADFQ